MITFTKNGGMAVLTTRFVLVERESILYVYHYEEDDMWEFRGDHFLEESDYRLVSVDELLEVDLTILELVDLLVGCFAYRENKGAGWKRGKL